MRLLSKFVPTVAEALLLERRRLGLTQHTRAEQLDVSARVYIAWEKGTRAVDYQVPEQYFQPSMPEKLFLLRRRAGLRQGEIARELGCCRWWMNQMERGLVPHAQLETFWKKRLRCGSK